MVDIDDRPSMKYLYGVIYCVKEEMLRKFKKKEARV
jgi:hypothetical protein